MDQQIEPYCQTIVHVMYPSFSLAYGFSLSQGVDKNALDVV